MIKFMIFGMLIFTLIGPKSAFSQEADSTIYKVETRDGNIFFGVIISETDELLVIETKDIGNIELQKSKIKSLKPIDSKRIKNGAYWFENPQSTRYLFGTNAIGLKAGEGYYQNTWVFFNNVNYGITKNFSLGAGLVPLFLFGAGATPLWVMPKVSIPVMHTNLYASVGGLFGGAIGDGESLGVGMAYGVLSYGNRDSNLTFGMGFGYADGEWADIPIFTISGMHRIKQKLYLVSENYFVVVDGESLALMSAALRWAPENFAVDFGLIRPSDVGGEFIGAPWLGVSIPFGGE